MAWVKIIRDPLQCVADDLLIEHGIRCDWDDCPTIFDPFEVAEHGGIPPHDCGELVPVEDV